MPEVAKVFCAVAKAAWAAFNFFSASGSFFFFGSLLGAMVSNSAFAKSASAWASLNFASALAAAVSEFVRLGGAGDWLRLKSASHAARTSAGRN